MSSGQTVAVRLGAWQQGPRMSRVHKDVGWALLTLCVSVLSGVRLFVTPRTVARQAPVQGIL